MPSELGINIIFAPVSVNVRFEQIIFRVHFIRASFHMVWRLIDSTLLALQIVKLSYLMDWYHFFNAS